MIHRRHCCNTMRGRDDHAPAADRYREEYKPRAGSEMQRETEHPLGGVAAGTAIATSWLNEGRSEINEAASRSRRKHATSN